MADARNRNPQGSGSRRWPAFLRAEGGATAVEFALIATPFFALLFGIIELGLIFLVSSSLENATSEAARTIRTGQFQTGGAATQAAFKNTICADFPWLQSDCNNNLSVDVETFANFGAVTAPNPVTAGVFNPAALQFTPGGPGQVVSVRAYYQWPLIVPLMDQALQPISGGKFLLTSTAIFCVEPYGSAASASAC